MSITVIEKLPRPTTVDDMEVGDYGRIETGPYIGHIVFRIWNDQVVSLNNPRAIWNTSVTNHDHVHIFPKGSTLTVQVGLISGEVYQEVKRLLGENLKINAIKAVRTATSLGLKEAKDYVDSFKDQPDPEPIPF